MAEWVDGIRRFTVVPGDHGKISRQTSEIHRLLDLPGGSPLDPQQVRAALQNTIESRVVPLGRYKGIITLGTDASVPVPIDVWVKIAYLPVELLGLWRRTIEALQALRINTVGNLLLYTQDELAAQCEASAIRDVTSCLHGYGLWLPTVEQLHRAKEDLFWVELPDGDCGVRVARELAEWEQIADYKQLVGDEGESFCRWAWVTVGDVLRETEESVKEIVKDCVFRDAGVSVDTEGLDQQLLDKLIARSALVTDRVVGWVRQADLKFLPE